MGWDKFIQYPCACSVCKTQYPDQSKRPLFPVRTIRDHLRKDSNKKMEIKAIEGYYVVWYPYGPLDREFVPLSQKDLPITEPTSSGRAEPLAKSKRLDLDVYFASNPHITKGQLFADKFLSSPDGKLLNIEMIMQSLHHFLKKNEHSENVDLADSICAVLTKLDADTRQEGVKVLSTMKQFKRGVEKFLTPLLKFDVCVNECVIFELCQDPNIKECPNPDCKEARFKNGQPRRQILYAPVLHRIQRWFGVRRIAKYIRTELDRILSTKFNIVSDIRETEHFKTKFADYEPDKHIPIALRLMADGFQPYKFRGDISFMLMAVSNLILSPKLRNALGNFAVISVYDEQRSGIKNIGSKYQFHLQLLASELLAMKDGSVVIWDAYIEKMLPVRLFFFASTGDYSQQVKTLNNGSTNGHSCCISCKGKLSVLPDVNCNVMTHFGDPKNFEEMVKIRRIQKRNLLDGKSAQFDEVRKNTGVGGPCVLDPLGASLDPCAHTFLDVMHATNNVMKRLFPLIRNDMEHATGKLPTCKCKRTEKMKRIHLWSKRCGATAFNDATRFRASFNSISLKEMNYELTDKRRGLKLPTHIDLTTTASVFDKSDIKFNYKFHNYFTLACHNLMPFLMDMVATQHELGISDEVASTICNLFHLMDSMNRDALSLNEIDWVTSTARKVFAQCLRHLDVVLFRTSFYLLIHIAEGLEIVGNLKSTSQFNFEHKLGCYRRSVICPPRPVVALLSRIQKLEFFGHLIAAKSIDMTQITLNPYEKIWSAASALRPMVSNRIGDTFPEWQGEIELDDDDKDALDYILSLKSNSTVVRKVGKVLKSKYERTLTYSTVSKNLKDSHVALLENETSPVFAKPLTLGIVQSLYWLDGENAFATIKTVQTEEFGRLSGARISTGENGQLMTVQLKSLSEPLIVSMKFYPKIVFVSIRQNRLIPVSGVPNTYSNEDELSIFPRRPLPNCTCKKGAIGRSKPPNPITDIPKTKDYTNTANDQNNSEISSSDEDFYSDSDLSERGSLSDPETSENCGNPIHKTRKRNACASRGKTECARFNHSDQSDSDEL